MIGTDGEQVLTFSLFYDFLLAGYFVAAILL